MILNHLSIIIFVTSKLSLAAYSAHVGDYYLLVESFSTPPTSSLMQELSSCYHTFWILFVPSIIWWPHNRLKICRAHLFQSSLSLFCPRYHLWREKGDFLRSSLLALRPATLSLFYAFAQEHDPIATTAKIRAAEMHQNLIAPSLLQLKFQRLFVQNWSHRAFLDLYALRSHVNGRLQRIFVPSILLVRALWFTSKRLQCAERNRTYLSHTVSSSNPWITYVVLDSQKDYERHLLFK